MSPPRLQPILRDLSINDIAPAHLIKLRSNIVKRKQNVDSLIFRLAPVPWSDGESLPDNEPAGAGYQGDWPTPLRGFQDAPAPRVLLEARVRAMPRGEAGAGGVGSIEGSSRCVARSLDCSARAGSRRGAKQSRLTRWLDGRYTTRLLARTRYFKE
jgi:hypothetical protein